MGLKSRCPPPFRRTECAPRLIPARAWCVWQPSAAVLGFASAVSAKLATPSTTSSSAPPGSLASQAACASAASACRLIQSRAGRLAQARTMHWRKVSVARPASAVPLSSLQTVRRPGRGSKPELPRQPLPPKLKPPTPLGIAPVAVASTRPTSAAGSTATCSHARAASTARTRF